jgi:hypothetical protein
MLIVEIMPDMPQKQPEFRIPNGEILKAPVRDFFPEGEDFPIGEASDKRRYAPELFIVGRRSSLCIY